MSYFTIVDIVVNMTEREDFFVGGGNKKYQCHYPHRLRFGASCMRDFFCRASELEKQKKSWKTDSPQCSFQLILVFFPNVRKARHFLERSEARIQDELLLEYTKASLKGWHFFDLREKG